MPPLSATLKKIVGSDRDPEEELDLEAVCDRVATVFSDHADLAMALFAGVSGRMKAGALGTHLLKLLEVDSAVRDVVTTGHLAKFLSRLEVFQRTSDYRIVGMPHLLFDPRSHEERAEYFKHGASLELESDAFEAAETQAMLDRENKLFAKYKYPGLLRLG